MTTFSERAIKAIKSVPAGKVATYGQIALLAGSPRAARQIGWLLNSSSEKHSLPWHRIINSKGQLSSNDPEFHFEQRSRLEAEGIVFSLNNTIDLKVFGWRPGNLELED